MAKKTAPKKIRRAASPPEDNPLLRHEKLSVDRVVHQNGPPRAATAPAKKTPKKGKAKAGQAANGATLQAELRLAALQHLVQVMSPAGGEVPVLAGAPAPLGAEAEAVPPAPGISNWVQLGPTAIPNGQTYGGVRVLVTGRITAIVVDPTNRNTIYLGTAQGGVWKTTDGGRNWLPKTDHEASLAIGALALDPANPQVLYAGTGEGNFSGDSYYGAGVLHSTNGGDTWATLGMATFMGSRFSRIAVTPGTPARLFAATSSGVLRSTNSGTAWTLLTNGLPGGPATDLVIDAATPDTVHAAFWGQGIYRTTNAGAANPTWTQLAGGLPTSSFTRVALGISRTSSQTIYALFAGPSPSYTVNRFYRTTDGGATWTAIALPGGNIGGQGFYNLYVQVDPTTPDIVYLGGISVWKATRNAASNTWTITDIGQRIHPDNHAFAFDPIDHQIIYAGNDGGVYKSVDGGTTWLDSINEGPCITQFEFIDDHPSADAVVFGGTQDNGTEQYRNSPVFYHADDGDGGFCAVDQGNPANVISTYYGPSPKRSVQAGQFGSWTSVSAGLAGSGLFYPPLALDRTNSNNIAFGTNQINLDSTQGTGGWPTKVALPGLTGSVSAIDYVNSNLIYAGTTAGQIFQLSRTGTNWTARAIQAAPLPGGFIWDVVARPDNANVVVVVMSGFGINHVWRGAVPATGPATWTNISGTGSGMLPDIPVNSLAIERTTPDTMYIGTDIGVFRTTNGGTSWTAFSQGLPNCAVFDLRLHEPTRLLRAGTHGRGLWERRLDALAMPDVDLFFRDHLMDSGRISPSPNLRAAFADPLQHVALGDLLTWWMCADIKVDAIEGSPPAYQMNVADVDYAAFESKLEHRNPQRGQVNRVYVQVHNRGIAVASSVVVKLLFADASAGLPPLPADFWTAFPGNSTDTTNWKPIGTAKILPSVSPTEPVIVEWDWATPTTAADHSCALVIADCAANPIPAANKVFDIGTLVSREKRVGLKNLHVVNATLASPRWSPFRFCGNTEQSQTIRLSPCTTKGWGIGLLFSKNPVQHLELKGMTQKALTQAQLKALKYRIGTGIGGFETERFYVVTAPDKGGQLAKLKLPATGLQAMLLLTAPAAAAGPGSVSIIQEEGNIVRGGSTFVLRTIPHS